MTTARQPAPGAGVTDDAIEPIRELIASGEWGPGTRLPREADLAAQLGLSRNSLREAVRALSLARVLEVRQGDGTYVSSLEPRELLEPTLLGDPSAARAGRCSSCSRCGGCSSRKRRRWPRCAPTTTIKAALRRELDRMFAAGDRAEDLVEADAAFHDVIGQAPGNAVLRSLLRSLSTSTVRARLWHGMADRGALDTGARGAHAHLRGDRRGRRRSRPCARRSLHIATQRDLAARAPRPADDVRSTGDLSNRASDALGLGMRAARAACTSRVGRGGRARRRRARLGARHPLFDTAPLYGSGLAERRLGAALAPAARRVRRLDEGRPAAPAAATVRAGTARRRSRRTSTSPTTARCARSRRASSGSASTGSTSRSSTIPTITTTRRSRARTPRSHGCATRASCARSASG